MLQKTVFIVDDNPGYLESMAWMLEGVGYQVEIFSRPEDCLQDLITRQTVNLACMLMDVRMPEMTGLDLHDQLRNSGIDLPVIYMTGHGDVSLAVEAMKKGAVTFLEKPLDNLSLKSALNIAFMMAEKAKYKKTIKNDNREKNTEDRLGTLTPREIEIMEGVVDGKLNKIIAYDLGISIKTVELHRSRVMAKMRARNVADLVKMVVTCAAN